jgi:heterodisulfide reductase subunit B
MEEVLYKSDKNLDKSDKNQPAFTGFGAEWRPSNLTPSEARAATSWVEAKIDRRSMLTNKDRVADIRDAMWQLEKDGEILVHRIDERHEPVVARTLYGWEKRIPTTNLWHHKSCGQCGNIPGYPSSVMWLMNKLNVRYIDETDLLHGLELSWLRHRQRCQPRRRVLA